MKYNTDETKDAKLNMKTHYIITYDDEIMLYNRINLGVISNKIILLTFNDTYTYMGFICPNINSNFVTSNTNSDDDEYSLISTSESTYTTKINEYVEFKFDLTSNNSEFNMNSNALNNICSSHEYEYFVYFEKITFSDSAIIEKTLNENNVLYYSSQTDTNNKILVELQKNYDVNNKYYIKSAQPGSIVIYYSINYKFKCTPNYQTFEDNDNDSDKIMSYNKLISIYVDGCNENCMDCVEDNEMFECQKCKDGYYPLLYFKNDCYDELEGFMLKNDKWVECFDSCATCSKANEDIPYYETFKDIQMYCTSCKEGYYKMIGNESQCFSEYESSYLNITIDKKDEVIETNNNITNINNINISSEGDLAVINETNKILNSITKLLKNNDIESLLYTKNEIENPNYKENGSNIEKIIIQVYDNTINAQDNVFFIIYLQ